MQQEVSMGNNLSLRSDQNPALKKVFENMEADRTIPKIFPAHFP